MHQHAAFLRIVQSCSIFSKPVAPLVCLSILTDVSIKRGTLLSADKDMQLGRIFEDRCAEMYYRVRATSSFVSESKFGCDGSQDPVNVHV